MNLTKERNADEGVVAINQRDEKNITSLILNCETDFVQKNSNFLSAAESLAEYFALLPAEIDSNSSSLNLNTLSSSPLSSFINEKEGEGNTEDLLAALSVQFDEKISISKIERFNVADDFSCFGVYVHNQLKPNVGKVAAIVEVKYKIKNTEQVNTEENEKEVMTLRKRLSAFAKLLAMQVVATKPKYLSFKSVPNDVKKKEEGIHKEAARLKLAATTAAATAAETAAETAARAAARRSLEERCLLHQEFLMYKHLREEIFPNEEVEREADHDNIKISNVDFAANSTVEEIIQMVGKRLGCSLEVISMRRIAVGES